MLFQSKMGHHIDLRGVSASIAALYKTICDKYDEMLTLYRYEKAVEMALLWAVRYLPLQPSKLGSSWRSVMVVDQEMDIFNRNK